MNYNDKQKATTLQGKRHFSDTAMSKILSEVIGNKYIIAKMLILLLTLG